MKTNIVIYSEELNQEDIRILLQAVRDCEKKHFKVKQIGIALFVPELKQEQCQEILHGIKPPFPHVKPFSQGIIC